MGVLVEGFLFLWFLEWFLPICDGFREVGKGAVLLISLVSGFF